MRQLSASVPQPTASKPIASMNAATAVLASALSPAMGSAQQYYLRGRQTLPRQTREGLTNSVRMFERAIALDSAYAPAYAGLAMAHAVLYEWFGSTDADRVAAERASERGLALAANLADAHFSRGCALTLTRRYEEAAQAFETAIDLNKKFRLLTCSSSCRSQT
jgi:tetratricopeptide (TPR) repeat protein